MHLIYRAMCVCVCVRASEGGENPLLMCRRGQQETWTRRFEKESCLRLLSRMWKLIPNRQLVSQYSSYLFFFFKSPHTLQTLVLWKMPLTLNLRLLVRTGMLNYSGAERTARTKSLQKVLASQKNVDFQHWLGLIRTAATNWLLKTKSISRWSVSKTWLKVFDKAIRRGKKYKITPHNVYFKPHRTLLEVILEKESHL